MTRLTQRRSDTRAAVRRLLKVQRGLIAEIGQLRVLILELHRAHQFPRSDLAGWRPVHGRPGEWERA